VQSVFTPKNLERTWAPRIREICGALVDRAVREREVDAFRALSLPLPIQVIAEIIGIPDGDLTKFKEWSDAMCDGVNQHLDEDVRVKTARAFADLSEYFAAKVKERRGHRGEDIVTMLCDAGDEERLTDKEIVHFLILLLIAGNETTTKVIGNGLMALVDHPEEQAKLRAKPELLDRAIEEMLRYCPPTQAMFRQTTRAVEVRGTTIAADRRVMLSIASANRDEAQFTNADKFQVDRDPNDHVAFGTGIHFCIGAALARMELRALFSMLLDRTRSIQSAGKPELISTIVIRGPVKLPLAFA
jgi:cytochrome P450